MTSDLGVSSPDSLKMFEATLGFPDQLEQAITSFDFPNVKVSRESIENIAFCGMGGSGMVGHLTEALLYETSPIPIGIINSYEIPGYVSSTTLFLAISFSGNTEETLICTEKAYELGAEIIAFSTGGELYELSQELNFAHVKIPRFAPQPRAALPSMCVPAWLILEKIGVFGGAREYLNNALEILKQRQIQYREPNNSALEIAKAIQGKIPLIYGTNKLAGAIGMRFKAQVNENAKSLAFVSEYPELCHNELVGFGLFGDVTRQLIQLIEIKVDTLHPQTLKRIQFVDDVLREHVAGITEVHSKCDADLCSCLDLLYLLDMASIYLSRLYEVDPGPIDILDKLKQFLANQI